MSEEIVTPPGTVEQITVPMSEDEKNLSVTERLKLEAQSLNHQLHHMPKNPFCEACMGAKMKEKIEEVLSSVGLKNKLHKMPHELSGGEQQRVVIARALLNDPELILADEPTGNLDPDTSDDIMNLLKNINQNTGTAVLFATHDYRLIQKFPFTVVRCIEGELLEHSLIKG